MSKIGLAVDGGGARGLGVARFLAHFEKATGSQCDDAFDLIGGTSTGSILACALATGTPAAGVEELYLEHLPAIFRRSLKDRLRSLWGARPPLYPSERLKAALDASLGDLRLSDCRPDIVVPSYEMTRGESVFFKSRKAKVEAQPDIRLSQVCLASSSAPYYFRPAGIARQAYIDGGVHSNNPSIVTYVEMRKMFGRGHRVLSLGTGSMKNHMSLKKAMSFSVLDLAKNLVTIFMDSSNETTVHMIDRLIEDRVLRCNLKADSGLDDISKDTIQALLDHGDRMWWSNRQRVLDFVEG